MVLRRSMWRHEGSGRDISTARMLNDGEDVQLDPLRGEEQRDLGSLVRGKGSSCVFVVRLRGVWKRRVSGLRPCGKAHRGAAFRKRLSGVSGVSGVRGVQVFRVFA